MPGENLDGGGGGGKKPFSGGIFLVDVRTREKYGGRGSPLPFPSLSLLAPPLANRTRRKRVVTREFNPFFCTTRVPFVPAVSFPVFTTDFSTARRGVSPSLSPWYPKREISGEVVIASQKDGCVLSSFSSSFLGFGVQFYFYIFYSGLSLSYSFSITVAEIALSVVSD